MREDGLMEQFCGIDPESENAIEVSVEHGVVASVQPAQEPCSGLPFIARGFIDIQVNGCIRNRLQR